MEDYPRTLRELDARFATEHACREYLARLRWGQEFVCPADRGVAHRARAWMSRGRPMRLAGTIFQGTRTPLSVWFRAIWWVVSQKNGASALGLQRVLGLGSYRTAWRRLHKLRRAMVRPGDRVSEEVARPSWAGRGGRRPPTPGREGAGGHCGRGAGPSSPRVAASSRQLLTCSTPWLGGDAGSKLPPPPKRGYRHDRRVLLGLS